MKPLPSTGPWSPWRSRSSIGRRADLGRILRKIDRYSTLGAQEAFAAGRRSSIWSALLRAKFTFFQDYLLRGGFLDGPQGLTLAVTDAVNKFFKYAKLSELSRRAAEERGKGRMPPQREVWPSVQEDPSAGDLEK